MLTDKGQKQDTEKLLRRIKKLEQRNRLLEERHKKLESRMEFILGQVPMLFFEVDANGTFREIGGKGLELLDHSREEVIGMSAFEMEKRWPEMKDAVKEALKGRPTSRILHTSDGQSYLACQQPLQHPDHTFNGFMGVAYDITPYVKEGKKSTYKDSLLRFFVKHTPAAIAMLDKDLNYIMYSDRWVQDYRLEDEELIGRNHYEVFEDVPEKWKKVHQRCLRGVTESCEEDPYRRADGHVDYVNWVVTPWYTENNEVGGLIFFTEVVNERVEASKRQKEMARAVKLSHHRMQEFVYALSHNLRDPLESAILLVDFINQNLKTERRASIPRTVNFLHTHISRLSHMVEELHSYASEDRKASRHSIDLGEIVEQVLSNLANEIPSGETEVIYTDLPSIQANEFEMIALFQHLLANAMSHYEGEELKIEIQTKELEEHWLIRIKDNSPGMSEHDRKEVFDLFRQLDADRGSGISLPMSQKIVERMGGQIWVEPESNKGNEFLIRLPKLPANQI